MNLDYPNYCNYEGYPCIVASDTSAWLFKDGAWSPIDTVEAGHTAKVIGKEAFDKSFGILPAAPDN